VHYKARCQSGSQFELLGLVVQKFVLFILVYKLAPHSTVPQCYCQRHGESGGCKMYDCLSNKHHHLVDKAWVAGHLKGTVLFYLADPAEHNEPGNFDLIKYHVAVVLRRHPHLGAKITELNPRHH
jgi:hypothetical protein